MNHMIQHIDTPPYKGGWPIFSGGLFSWWPIFWWPIFSGGPFSWWPIFRWPIFWWPIFWWSIFSPPGFVYRIIELTNKAGDDLMNSNTIKSFKWKIKQWVKSNIKVKPIAKGNSLSIEVSGASFQGELRQIVLKSAFTLPFHS